MLFTISPPWPSTYDFTGPFLSPPQPLPPFLRRLPTGTASSSALYASPPCRAPLPSQASGSPSLTTSSSSTASSTPAALPLLPPEAKSAALPCVYLVGGHPVREVIVHFKVERTRYPTLESTELFPSFSISFRHFHPIPSSFRTNATVSDIPSHVSCFPVDYKLFLDLQRWILSSIFSLPSGLQPVWRHFCMLAVKGVNLSVSCKVIQAIKES
jgi:hypothetical protein